MKLDDISQYLKAQEDNEYLSITDLSIQSQKSTTRWIRAKSTIEFMKTWESLHNSNFQDDHFQDQEIRQNTIKNWIGKTQAIGVVIADKRIYAHKDFAMHFLTWAYPELLLQIIKLFTMPKKDFITEEKDIFLC